MKPPGKRVRQHGSGVAARPPKRGRPEPRLMANICASVSPIVSEFEKIGRNDPCPCGSGKKHKKCCLRKGASEVEDA
jgi:hypothetical protein